jgi:glutamyl-tRNA synthetase
MGGVRTALYNYLFARQHGGDFILRIEDTDQNRYVPGAEQYIIESLRWCGISPNEGVGFGDGPHAPYRQSERKHLYKQYALQLVNSGHAYYAFDTAADLEAMRKKQEEAKESATGYTAAIRLTMRNSLTMPASEVEQLLNAGEHYVIRIKLPQDEIVKVNDLIRGEVEVHTSLLDDKVLYKSDGMPTYHLANVVDDYLMQITHVIRGEEWLPSAPLHVLLYRYLGWEQVMPQFAHLPLLLKPDGNGKLSKRDGDRLGFPVFPLNWTDPQTGELSSGYREKGYFPEAFLNILALLGWHPSSDKEIFSLEELVHDFSLERITKSGAKFDPEKAKWFNQHYLRTKTGKELAQLFMPEVKEQAVKLGFAIPAEAFVEEVCRLIKEKAHFVNEFWSLSHFMFVRPVEYDAAVIAKKWNDNAYRFFEALIVNFNKLDVFTAAETEGCFKQTAADSGIKPGDVMQLFRVLLSGAAGGPMLFEMAELLSKEEVNERLKMALSKQVK